MVKSKCTKSKIKKIALVVLILIILVRIDILYNLKIEFSDFLIRKTVGRMTDKEIKYPTVYERARRAKDLYKTLYLIKVRLEEPVPNYYALTTRQREVAHLLVLGYSREEIGKELGIGVETVRTHATNIAERTGIKVREFPRWILKEIGDLVNTAWEESK